MCCSVMDCYAAEFEPLPVSEHGSPLEHLVACISGVELVHTGSNKHMRLCQPRPPVDNKSDGKCDRRAKCSLRGPRKTCANEKTKLFDLDMLHYYT